MLLNRLSSVYVFYRSACVFPLLFLCLHLQAQTDISGVINDYVEVTNVSNNCDCPATDCGSITVLNASGFSVGDRVLLIQMKGALADSSNTVAHGSLINVQDAGNYEFATITAITGNDITTEYPLNESYFTGIYPADSACVQLIRVPVYPDNVNVTGTLMAQTWNGRTGGVLALEVGGTLTLQADISVDGQGFKGARRLQTTLSCSYDTAFYYQSTHFNYSSCSSCDWLYDDTPTRWSELAKYGGCCGGGGCLCQTNRMTNSDFHLAGYRGEGIVANTFMKRGIGPSPSPYFESDALYDKGRGRWGNGGGGGGNHNAGGGGGGNYGAGGFGGNTFNVTGGGSGCNSNILNVQRGYGGVSLTPTSSKVFLGGGGGEGHDNGGNGSTGTNGGGIIFITATSIANSGAYTISANGVDNNVLAAGDGSGGGGAGGSILLDVGYYSDPVTITAAGGKGGDHNNNTCHGTGGGGGGGLIWFSQGSQPANVTSGVAAGINGIQVAPTFDCDPDTNWGATPGTDGTTIFEGNSGFLNENTCGFILPVKWISFVARSQEQSVALEWVTGNETNSQYFTVERSRDAKSFQALGTLPAAGNSNEAVKYNFVDEHPISGTNYYRLKQTDHDGNTDYSRVVQVSIIIPQVEWKISPNPATNTLRVNLDVPNRQDFSLAVYDLFGKQVLGQALTLAHGTHEVSFDISLLNPGCYFIILSGGSTRLYQQFIKQ